MAASIPTLTMRVEHSINDDGDEYVAIYRDGDIPASVTHVDSTTVLNGKVYVGEDTVIGVTDDDGVALYGVSPEEERGDQITLDGRPAVTAPDPARLAAIAGPKRTAAECWRDRFTCGHCGADVCAYMPEPERGQPVPRNHCPECLWSKHVAIGEQTGFPPCGAMMRGTDVGDGRAVWRCLGCGFMMRATTDAYLMSGALNDALGMGAGLTLYGD